MFNTAIIITVISCIFLILIILLQNDKSKLQNDFLNSNTNQIIGVKKTKNILEKTTWILCFIIFICIIFSSTFIKNKKQYINSNIIKNHQNNNL